MPGSSCGGLRHRERHLPVGGGGAPATRERGSGPAPARGRRSRGARGASPSPRVVVHAERARRSVWQRRRQGARPGAASRGGDGLVVGRGRHLRPLLPRGCGLRRRPPARLGVEVVRVQGRGVLAAPGLPAVLVLVLAGAANHDPVALDRDRYGAVALPVLGVYGVVLHGGGEPQAVALVAVVEGSLERLRRAAAPASPAAATAAAAAPAAGAALL